MESRIKEKYLEDGYVILEDFLSSEEIGEIKDTGVELTKNVPRESIQSVFSSINPQKISSDYIIKSNDKVSYFLEEDAAKGDKTVELSQSINKIGHAIHWLNPVFRKYTFSNKVKQICKELDIKTPAVVQSMYIYKNPRVGGVVLPHQDATYLYTHPVPPVGFWIAADDATIENGCLWIARGSHKSGVQVRYLRREMEDGEAKLDFDGTNPTFEDTVFTAVPVKRGTCILLHGNVVHKSAPNRSAKSRHAYTFHVIEKENNEYCRKNWLQEGPEAPWENLYFVN